MLNQFNDQLIEENDHLVVAVSGGMDSMVLLDHLIQLKELRSLTLIVAHIDHQKRQSSSEDAAFVENYAHKHNLAYYLLKLTFDHSENFHDYAHKKRYDFFVEVAKQTQANKIVLAHHLDDLAETILMRLARGSSFEGYQGIQERAYYQTFPVIRPMLYITKESIQAYQQSKHIPFCVDESNDEDDYTRNRFRHHIVPLLKNENPKFLEKMKQFSFYQAKTYAFIHQETTHYLNTVNKRDNLFSFSKLQFEKQPEIIQIEAIKTMVNRLTHNQVELTFTNMNDMVQLILSDKPHLEYHLGDNLFLYKRYNKIVLQTTPENTKDYECIIKDVGHYSVNHNVEAFISKKANKNYDYIYKLCYNNLELTFPITIRNRRQGDRLDIQIGTKKLKDFFIDKKIPMDQRNQLPLIVNQHNEILFIPDLFSKKQEGNNTIYIHLNINK